MKANITNVMSDFVKERNEALFSLDEGKIRTFSSKYGVRLPENPKIFWGGVYKAIYNITDAPMKLKRKAKKWLNDNGMSPYIF